MAAITGSVSRNLALDCLLQIVSKDDEKNLRKLMQPASFSTVTVMTRLRILSGLECRLQVDAGNVRTVLEELALLKTVYQPYCCLLQIARGLRCFPTLWNGVSEEALQHMYSELTPSIEAVIEHMQCEYAEDKECRYAEERVVHFMETFLSSLSRKELEKVLIFWTASNVLHGSLKLAFNSAEGACRCPHATTCTSTLTVSRLYLTDDEFRLDMNVMICDEDEVMSFQTP